MTTQIRLGDDRDLRDIAALRKQGDAVPLGGLWELLTWPVYHVHTARRGDRTVAYTSVALFPDGTADDCGTVVAEGYRGQGIAHLLRATQVRDLLVMGWEALYVTVSRDNAPGQGCARAHFGDPLSDIDIPGLPPMVYFGDHLPAVQARLSSRGASPNHPLSPQNLEKLRHKAATAKADLVRLGAHGTLSFQKAALRAPAARSLAHV